MEVAIVGIISALLVGVPVTLWRYWHERANKFEKLFEAEQALIQDVAENNKALKRVIEIQATRIKELHAEIMSNASIDDIINGMPDPTPNGSGPN